MPLAPVIAALLAWLDKRAAEAAAFDAWLAANPNAF